MEQNNVENFNRRLEVEGVIQSIKYPFSFSKKINPIVSIRLMSGQIMEMEATDQMIKALPTSIGVGMYTEAQYCNHPSGNGYQLLNLF